MGPLAHLQIGLKMNGIFLSSLYILHVYWFYLFIQIGIKLATKGKTDDLQAQVKTDDRKEAEMNKYDC